MPNPDDKNSFRHFPMDILVFAGWPIIPIAFLCIFVMDVISRRQMAFFWIAIAAAGIGIVLLYLARLPLYREGKFLTFGSRALDPKHRRLYRCAYVFIYMAIALQLVLLMQARIFNTSPH